jgi:hypothetical protein
VLELKDTVKPIVGRIMVGTAACVLGVVLWIGLSVLGGSPLDSGGRFLASLVAAGFVVAVIEGELHWAGLLGLFLGQIGALCGQALVGEPASEAQPLPLQMLFILSYNLAAAIGGAIGAILRSARRGWKPAREEGA